MALTNTVRNVNIEGARKAVTVDITFDSSYATGGEAFVPDDVGLSVIDFADIAATGGRTFSYSASTGKILAYAGSTEVTNATDLSAVTVRARIWGY